MPAAFRTSATIVLIVAAALTQAQVPLSKRVFKEKGASNGTVVMQINWGRYWKCGPYENAQLQRLSFRRLTDSSSGQAKDWELTPSSTLLAKPLFSPYAFVIEPGEYALSGVRMKLALSAYGVTVADADPSKLIVNGQAMGGSFTVAAGEIVYIGHFGMECSGEPTPWRYYVVGRQEFDSYAEGFHKRFPFVKETPVVFRLFKTDSFGQAYDLPE